MDFAFSIDRGGTFTDIYYEYTSRTGTRESGVGKLLSVDPNNYSDAPTEGIRRILQDHTDSEIPRNTPIPTEHIKSIRMGTTVATNALLERKGERIAFVTTKGFADILEIGNQSREKIFDLKVEKPSMVYETVIEINERVHVHQTSAPESDNTVTVSPSGEKFDIITPIDEDEVRSKLTQVFENGIRCIAVTLVHSYVFKAHEEVIKKIAEEIGFTRISLSSEIMPMVKLVPRGSTTCIDAYLTPAIQTYINQFRSAFDQGINQVAVLFMQSDGGLAPVDDFTGSRAILSGPAGGVVGFSLTSDIPSIGFDMGGTSTDVSRFAGDYDLIFESKISGISIQSPQLDINTVASGGGSRLFFQSGIYVVGPESSSADPGPVCYGKNGLLSITDANLVLGRLIPEFFPKIFGPNEDQPLDRQASLDALQKMTDEINAFNGTSITVQEVALGFVRVANETMCRPIRALTQAKGHDPKTHMLACFGGAGGQHSCDIARSLGIRKVRVHKYSGILSAYGLGLADIYSELQEPCSLNLTQEQVIQESAIQAVEERMKIMEATVTEKLHNQGYTDLQTQRYLHLRYSGTDTQLIIKESKDSDFLSNFLNVYKTEYGFTLVNREIIIDVIRVRGVAKSGVYQDRPVPERDSAEPIATQLAYCEVNGAVEGIEVPVYDLEKLAPHQEIPGPCIVLNQTSTIVIDPESTVKTTSEGNLDIIIPPSKVNQTADNVEDEVQCDSIELSIFAHRFMSIAEQMGRTLQRTSISTNIKERLDYSCAIFGPDGSLVANAPHLPVHLGAMQEAVRYQITSRGEDWTEGQVIMSNHPSAGGSHLPDITIITPVFREGKAVLYVANRGHHADIGGISPGSMPPFSKFLDEEGAAVKSFIISEGGVFNEEGVSDLLTTPSSSKPGVTGTRLLRDNISDLKAQIASNTKGIGLLQELIEEHGLKTVQAYMKFIQNAAAESVRNMLVKLSYTQKLPEIGKITAEDHMDEGCKIKLTLTIDRNARSAHFDFTGTGNQVYSNLNAPMAVVKSAIIYCLRCMIDSEVPLNQGCLDPVEIFVPESCILNPTEDAAIVGGNVLTSQRVTDVIFKAFGAVSASQGCMNNFTFGNENLGFYETICGGSGAGPTWHGANAVHTHMTNTRITDVEIMERRYPVVIDQFAIREGSGGAGEYSGGHGVIRELQFLEPMDVGILSERRTFRPYGLNGGEPGAAGQNVYIRNDGTHVDLGGKNTVKVAAGEKIKVLSPGAGGYGSPSQAKPQSPDSRIYQKESGSVAGYKSTQEQV